MNQVLRKEFAGAMCGVAGRFHNVIGEAGASTLASQTFTTETRPCPSYGEHAVIRAEVRFDDNCRNGHNTFAITADVRDSRYHGSRGEIAGGCCHEAIAKTFPELAHLVRWHLTSTDGPMHYIANTVYLAGDRDHFGRRKGEVASAERRISFGANPIKHRLPSKFIAFLEAAKPHPGRGAYDFEVIAVPHERDPKTYGTKYTYGGYGSRWHECPFDNETRARDFLVALQTCEPKFHTVPTTWSEGKPRDLDAARRTAIWPDASDAELSVEPDQLKLALAKRHPHLMRAFRQDMEAAGLIWTDSDTPAIAAVEA